MGLAQDVGAEEDSDRKDSDWYCFPPRNGDKPVLFQGDERVRGKILVLGPEGLLDEIGRVVRYQQRVSADEGGIFKALDNYREVLTEEYKRFFNPSDTSRG